MNTAGSRVASWHLRQDVPSGQGSRCGTRVLGVGGKARYSSWTPGLPKDKRALARVLDGHFLCIVGIYREAGLIFLRRVVCLVQGAPRR